MAKRNEQGERLGDSRKSRGKIAKKQKKKPAERAHQFNVPSSDEVKAKQKKTLQELHLNPPPAFRKFESEVDWRTIDEEIALQLWEDVFRPLYTFH